MSNRRILFAAPKSGSGKTMITCGVLAILKKRGLRVKAFKCGPDFIDPMFHRKALGIASGNLDTFFTDADTTRYIFRRDSDNRDIAVIEGVMGYYDGLGGNSTEGSTYEVAVVTDTPVILIVDAKGASVSLAAMIRGIIEYRTDSRIVGVILNRVSAGYFDRLRALIEKECGLKVFGYVPELKELSVPSRHLGLVQPGEAEAVRSWADSLAEKLGQTIDIDAILKAAEAGGISDSTAPVFNIPRLPGRVRIAVARDEAFSFYYSENMDILKEMGADIVEFSPLRGDLMPEAADGMIIGGGYPENYVDRLESSKSTAEIYSAVMKGMPCLAECGGFLYLQKELENDRGLSADMAGVLNGRGFPTGGLRRFGYAELETARGGLLGDRGEIIRGHEFHHWDCTENGSDFTAHKRGGQDYACMVHTDTLAAGFPHLYYYSNPGMLYSFLETALEYKTERLSKKHWDSIAKPLDSLGLLEEAVNKLCRINLNAGSGAFERLGRRALLTFCGDHGVVCEGVTQTGKDVTGIVSENFAKGCSSVNYMASVAGVDVYPIDIGIDADCYRQNELVRGEVINRKIRRGAGNIAVEPAMSQDECRRALCVGCELVGELKRKGYGLIATGEMGIGNTTPTSVLAALYLGLTPDAVLGRGAGLSDEGLAVKREVIGRAVSRVRGLGISDAFEILAQAGGLEIAGMAGAFLGGVKYRMPIIIDGAISSVAALAAYRMDSRVRRFAFASHESNELTGRLALEEMGLKAPVHAEMCLGEGTGAMTLIPLLDMAVSVYVNMGSFEDYSIEAYQRY
ncbi:MAG: cobyrinate a,c-diamide synthase [Lachnospiraceae bacterium]|nr:cobyrinate a,c-diamide synthase [Lachnospiraceae bacterium]